MARPVFVFHPEYAAPIGAHVFPIEKYARTRERLLAEGDTTPADWIEAPDATLEQLRLVHDDAYLDDFLHARWTPRTIPSEFPLDERVVRAFLRFSGGTIVAAHEAMARGFAVNVGGGFHHAFAGHAEGFCYLNDIAVAIRVLQDEGRIHRAAVIDCDLHQGNGTARIFAGDPDVFTFSIHQENLYPVKEDSDWDIGLADPAGDGAYLDVLREAVPLVFERARPQLVVYQAGADPYADDQLGNLGVSMSGLAARDALVLGECARRRVPCAVTLGGGYARRFGDTVAIHVGTCRATLAAAGEERP